LNRQDAKSAKGERTQRTESELDQRSEIRIRIRIRISISISREKFTGRREEGKSSSCLPIFL
jgi:hypothetical protein